MSYARAERRRHEKAARKGEPLTSVAPETAPKAQIQLANPMTEHFPAFIIGNGLAWEAMAHDELIRENREAAEALEPYWGLMALVQSDFKDAKAYESWCRFRDAVNGLTEQFVVMANSAKGQHVVIAGAGPSLAETAEAFVPKADQVWGCNSALPFLLDKGYRVTHGFTVDQTPDMVAEWSTAPDVDYLVATTIHPHLAQHLKANNRRMRWFHNFVGINRPPVRWPAEDGQTMEMRYEDWLYVTLFPGTVRAGSGLNTVTRAIDVALFMGFDTITVLGADCAMRSKGPMPTNLQHGSKEHLDWLRENTVFHADGGHALASNSTAVTLGAWIDSGTEDETIRPGCGRWWESKPDLLISARWLLVLEQVYKGRVKIEGDTYVAAIRHKNKAFLDRLPNLLDSNGKPLEIDVGDIARIAEMASTSIPGFVPGVSS